MSLWFIQMFYKSCVNTPSSPLGSQYSKPDHELVLAAGLMEGWVRMRVVGNVYKPIELCNTRREVNVGDEGACACKQVGKSLITGFQLVYKSSSVRKTFIFFF